MSWEIDRDYINAKTDGDFYRVGTKGHGPRTEDKVRFRLLDDDREVYYGGWLHDDGKAENQMRVLEFGTIDAGATIIEVKRNGEWVIEIG